MPVDPVVNWAINDIKARLPEIEEHRKLYEGRHPRPVPIDETISAEMRALLEGLRDNLCDDVVDEPLMRLSLQAIMTKTDAGDVNALWEAAKGAARFRSIARDSWMTGDGYAIVDEDANGNPRFHAQLPEQMAVAYDPERPDTIHLAAKCWPEGKRWRLTIYYGPTHEQGPALARYQTKGTSPGGGIPDPKAFEPYYTHTDDEGEPTHVENTDWARMPVFHFPAGEVSGYGRSILVSIGPLQFLLNKSVADLVMAMEDVALPQRHATGVQAQYNDDGTEKPFYRKTRRASEMLRTASENVKFGQFPAADLSQFLSVQADWRLEIARKGYLPPSSVGLDGDKAAASGLSLLVQEGRLNKRVKTAQQDWGGELKEMLAYMLTLDGTPTTSEDLDLEWTPPETRDETALWELLMLKRDLGVPLKRILLEGGYEEDDILEWLDEAAVDVATMGVPLTSSQGGAGAAAGVAAPPAAPSGSPEPNPVV